MIDLPDYLNCKVGIIGLGYVGLPLALQIAKTKICKNSRNVLNRNVVGFDISNKRIEKLKLNCDENGEYSSDYLKDITNIKYSSDINDLLSCDVFIVTVPTPIDDAKKPDLNYLAKASELVANCIKNKNCKKFPIVIYESTVYPGLTEEFCIPIIEKKSLLKGNEGFFYGYSPERINPGDKSKTIDEIIKVTSGSNEKVANWIDDFYSSIIKIGTHKAPSIKVAEAAKIIENTQRDINIALINELAIIFDLMKIDTLDVLSAAKTKWNFNDFKPGLVGGHCIGIDPYYLTYKSELLGYHPEIVLSGRRINDKFGCFIVDKLISSLIKKRFILPDSEILILGLTFKENCGDVRNTKVKNMIDRLNQYGCKLTVVDPLVNKDICKEMFESDIVNKIPLNKKFTAVILAVAHDYFCNLKANQWKDMVIDNGIFLDIKGLIPRELNPIRL